MYVLALSDYKQHAAAAGYKPAPQLKRVCVKQNACLRHTLFLVIHKD